ncbi:amino acid permease [Bacillus sp. RG28]|uniref:Amino acid permease n=1 Tax=Gottfriedia endophytica TaxID=2820819 RepID=A0A940NIQ1_9BACI|nr:amino acid permease [Gottfriedia endophytica]MBP0726099.1 amino acid permease [Gottfriedia endophytica]
MEKHQLKRVLKTRHLSMISMGGVIGTGLFLGAGLTINSAGAGGAIVAYLIGGVMTYLVMLCLGELAVAMPVTGSFQAYATKYIGPSTGFMVGIAYWMSWATTVGLEFTAAGLLMKRWFPHTPTWIWCLFFIILLFGLNAFTTKGFAETEYYFAGIKIVAIILFIIIGGCAVLGIIPLKGGQAAPFFSNLYNNGGFFPKGFTPILITMISVLYGFQGTELLGITAGESENPERDIPKATKNIIFRVLLFYVTSIVIVSAMVPWRKAGLVESPFVMMFDKVGIPYAADIMNFVILTAVLSVGNSGLYLCSRMFFAMSESGQVPKMFGKLNKRQIPMNALLVSLAFALLSLLTSVIAANSLFVVLLAISGIGTTIAWAVIALSHINFRRTFIKNGGKLEDLPFRVKWFPFVPVASFIMCVGIILSLVLDPAQRTSFYWATTFVVGCYIYYLVRFKWTKRVVSLQAAKVEENL